MTGEQKKSYLKSYRVCMTEIGRIEEEIEDIKNHKEDSRRREELAELLAKKRNDCARLCMDIIESIERMEGSDEYSLVLQKNLLVERYIRGKSWEEIEKIMSYQRTQLHRIHTKAIDNLVVQDTKIC